MCINPACAGKPLCMSSLPRWIDHNNSSQNSTNEATIANWQTDPHVHTSQVWFHYSYLYFVKSHRYIWCRKAYSYVRGSSWYAHSLFPLSQALPFSNTCFDMEPLLCMICCLKCCQVPRLPFSGSCSIHSHCDLGPFLQSYHESKCLWGCDRGQMRMALTFVTICCSKLLVICIQSHFLYDTNSRTPECSRPLTPWPSFILILHLGVVPSPDLGSAGWFLTLVSTVSNQPLAMDLLSSFLPTDFGHLIPEHSH